MRAVFDFAYAFFRIQLACYSTNRATPGRYIRSELDQKCMRAVFDFAYAFFVYSSLAFYIIELPGGAIFEVSSIGCDIAFTM